MIFNLYELIVFGITIFVLALLSINNVRLYLNNKNLLASLVQSTLDKLAVEDALNSLAKELELLSLKETDGFVKFLSESREAAFSYIEEVQVSIQELIIAMEESDEAKIAKAYANLIKHMPKEEIND